MAEQGRTAASHERTAARRLRQRHAAVREKGRAVKARRLVHSSTISGYMLGRNVGCAGSGIYHHAPWPLLPPFVPCPSTFCEKANPEETTVGRTSTSQVAPFTYT